MNRDALLGLARHALTTLGGALAGYGVIESTQVETIAGAMMALIGVALSVYDKQAR